MYGPQWPKLRPSYMVGQRTQYWLFSLVKQVAKVTVSRLVSYKRAALICA